jgi:Rrf2 family protein
VLTRKSKYGLKALLFLAREYERGAILASEVAEREGIPEKFLQGILLDLRRRGIVRSRRGLGGGYQLARDPAAINFGEVLRTLDGPLALTPCVSQTAYQRCDECADERSCGIRLVMKDVRDQTARILEGANLAGVIRAVDRRHGGRRHEELSDQRHEERPGGRRQKVPGARREGPSARKRG